MTQTNPRSFAVALLITSLLGFLGPALPWANAGVFSANAMSGGGLIIFALMGACVALAGIAAGRSQISIATSVISLLSASGALALFVASAGKIINAVGASNIGIGFYLTGAGAGITTLGSLLSFFVSRGPKSTATISFADRVEELEILRKHGMLSDAEYERRRTELTR